MGVPRDRKLQVWRRDKFRCRYCRCAVTIPSHDIQEHLWATVDHVRPKSMGGKNNAKNLVTACRSCNAAKGSSPASKFIAEAGAPRLSPGAALKFGYRSPNE